MKPDGMKWADWYDAWERKYRQEPHRAAENALALAMDFLKIKCREGGYPEVGPWWSGTQAYYVAMRLDGVEHKLAEMLACQQPPQSKTDREFLLGIGEQFADNQALGDYYGRVAREHGQNPKGKKYLSSLAAFPGDPEAWVDGRDDVRRVCEKRGWDCDGDVKVKGVRPDTSGPYRVADDIVQARAADLLESGQFSDAGEAAHVAREQLSPDLTPRRVT